MPSPATKVSKPRFTIPKQLGACADRLFDLKAKKAALNKELELLDEERSAIQNHLIETLPKSQAGGIAGKLARVTIEPKVIPQVKDYDLFYAFIKKSGRFDLLQRRLSDKAVEELWDDGKKVPGVEPFTTVVVRLNKV